MKRYLLLLLLLSTSAWAQFDGSITVEAVANNFTGSNVARTGYPVSFPETFKQGDVTSTSAFSLTGMGVSAAQYKVTMRWPDASIKSVVGDAIVNYDPATPAANVLHLSPTGGSGNFGGSSLAVDNSRITGTSCQTAGTSSGYICVNTGPLQVEIRKADYAFVTKVVVNGKVLVDDSVRASEGLVVLGPPSANDTNAVPLKPTAAPTVASVACTTFCPTASRTYVVESAYVSTSGQSPHSAASSSIVVPANYVLQVTGPSAPASGPSADGWYLYAGSSSGESAQHLQQPTGKPLALGSTWTEGPCQIVLNDGSISALAQGRCQGTGGVLNYTRGPEVYSIAGNSGCILQTSAGAASCTTPYKSSLDDGSTASIEENGPAATIIKAIGSYASSKKTCAAASDSSGNETVGCYGHFTDRLKFYKGQTGIWRTTIDRNADYTPASTATNDITTHQASDYRMRRSWEARLALAGADLDAGSKTYTFKANTSNTDCSGQQCTGTLSGDAMLYQAFDKLYERGEMNLNAYDRYTPPLLMTTAGAYLQTGYQIQANGSIITSAVDNASSTDPAHEVANMGWADIKDTNGRGVQIGIWYMAPDYPGALKFKKASTNNYDVVIGLLPDQTEPLAGNANINPQAAVPYTMIWPQYQDKRTYWNFHGTALTNPDTNFQAYQQFLLGRPALSDFNRSEFFTELYPMIKPEVMDGYLTNTVGKTGWDGKPPKDANTNQVWVRFWIMGASGEGNQHEQGYQMFRLWLQRGGAWASDYLMAWGKYHFNMMWALPRADFAGGWRGTCPSSRCDSLNGMGMPEAPENLYSPYHGAAGAGQYPSGNFKAANRNWSADLAHAHWEWFPAFAALTGDPEMLDAANQAFLDVAGNPNSNLSYDCTNRGTNCINQLRATGNAIAQSAMAYWWASSQGNSTDADQAKLRANYIIGSEGMSNGLGYGSEYGTGNKWSQSPVSGMLYSGAHDDGTKAGGDSHCPEDLGTSCVSAGAGLDGSNYGARIEDGLFTNIMSEAMVLASEVFGPTWTYNGTDMFTHGIDFAYGVNVNTFTNGQWTERHNAVSGCAKPSEIAACNPSTAGAGCWPGNPCSGWAYWNEQEWYNGDKVYTLAHGTAQGTRWFLLVPGILFTGDPNYTIMDPVFGAVSPREASTEYFLGHNGAEDGLATWSTLIGLFIDEDGNDPAISGKPYLTHFTWHNLPGNPVTPGGHWIDLAFTNSGCSGQTYCTVTGASPGNLTWSAPSSVVAYRMKMNPNAKQIVDHLTLDTMTNPHADGSGCASRYTAACTWDAANKAWLGECTSGGTPGIPPDMLTAQTPPYKAGHWWWGCALDNFNSSPITVNGITFEPKWPWFSSKEVGNRPVPPSTSFNPTTALAEDGITNLYQSAGQNTFALRAYVTTATPTAWLTATPATISSGESSTLQWATSNVTSASIDQGIGSVATSGNESVSPTSTTTYTLTGSGPNGSATASATVVVTTPPPAPTASITVTPAVINVGDSATLNWSTTDATTISIDQGIGSVGASGTWSITPQQTTTYIITATGAGGTATAQTTLTVIPAPPPATGNTIIKGATAKGAKVQ